jgi:uncharacterized protein (DUF2141 family)
MKMKRLFSWIIALGSFSSVYAQEPETGEYEATFDVLIRGGNNDEDCSNRFDFYTAVTGDPGELQTYIKFIVLKPPVITTWYGRHLWHQNLNPIGGVDWKYYQKKMPIPAAEKLTDLWIVGGRQYGEFGGCGGTSGLDHISISYTNCFQESYVNRILAWENNLTISIYPKAVNIYYYDRSNQRQSETGQHFLPQSHPIQIKATQGFPSVVYGWQYQIGDGAWQNFPASLSGSSILTLSGNDLPNVDFIQDVVLPGKSVNVRLSYGCGKYSTIIGLIPMLSAPNIVSVEPTPPSCSYFDDGTLTITMDRALYAGETIGFVLGPEKVKKGPENIDQLSPAHTYTLENLESFSDLTLSFNGRYKETNTYTIDPTSHNKTVSVPARTPVTFTAGPSAVHCYNGEDGKIQVMAQGGTGTYTAFLYQANILLNTIPLTEGAENSFLNLKAGTYTVKLRDSKGCEPRDAGQQEITYVRTVTQPAQRVALSTVDVTEPLGFGLSNGSVTVRSQNGTGPYTFHWTDSNGHPLTAQPTQTEGSSQKSTLANLGRGTYRVRVEDTPYGQASPPTEANICGCYDTLTLVVDEPPLLQVSLSEQHYVSCNGAADGELRALATGGRPYAAGEPLAPYRYEWFRVGPNGPQPFGASDPLVNQRTAGNYRAKVTDRNGITAWSADFELRQPPPLTLGFNTSLLLCNGDRNGTALALPQGGTPPYRYTWSTEQTTAGIDQLSDGTYSAVVTDARGCMVLGQAEISAPDGLTVTAEPVHPRCQGEANGSVQLHVEGGKPPYQYQWSSGQQTESISQLPAGTYAVRISDANGCFINRSYELAQPDRPPLNLGGDRVLCRDQQLDLDVTINDPAAQYRWLKDGASFADRPAVRLSEAGTYQVRITSGAGCTNGQELRISRDEAVIAAEMVVATRVPRGERVRIANISRPAPERVEWLVPAGARILEEQAQYLELAFDAEGSYAIGLRGYQGACQKTVYKTVRVVDKSELPDYQSPQEPYIKRFMVSPNPNDGRFTATVELRESADFKLILYSGQANPIMEKTIQKQAFSQVDFQLPASGGGGIYLLQLITAQGNSLYKVVVQ